MRYLAEAFALGALRRGRSIEQFLGRAAGEVPGIRWIEIVPDEAWYRVVLHVCGDVGGEHFCDLVEFPSLEEGDEEDFGEQVAIVAEASDALVAARDAVGASLDRWVNQGIAGDGYRDYVRAGRPATLGV
jgi:hypothetical protein